jgi:hypothetical protein
MHGRVWTARPINYNSRRMRPFKERCEIYPNRISFKELSDMLHDVSIKFKAQETVGSGQWAVKTKGSRDILVATAFLLFLPTAHC